MSNGCLHDFVRQAYYGGRVEVFREHFDGKDCTCSHCVETGGVLNYGDVNSMYPWAMLSPVPTELSYVVNGHVDLAKADKLGYCGFVECTVVIPEGCYCPPLPYRYDNKLIFPVGRFSGIWTSYELLQLERVFGFVAEFKRSVWFRSKEIFSGFVNYWYQYRNKQARNYSIGLDLIAKLFLNSLYGKFGMNTEREKLWFFPTEKDCFEHELTPLPDTDPAFGAFSETTNSEPPYVIPHIAAWITARSRIRLWSLMQDMLDGGYSIYYCDTDSIVTDAPISDSPKLGDLKTVCQIKRAKFVAPKMYFIEQSDGKHFIKAKGFSGGFGNKGLTEKQFNDVITHHTKVKLSRMRKLREGIRSGKRFPAMHESQKGVRSGILDEKRIHLVDGNTRPIDANSLG